MTESAVLQLPRCLDQIEKMLCLEDMACIWNAEESNSQPIDSGCALFLTVIVLSVQMTEYLK